MYRLFSRKTGWLGGTEVKFFRSRVIDNIEGVDMGRFIDKSGSEILEIAEKEGIDLPEHFVMLCKQYESWYLYEKDFVITTMISI